MPSGQLILKCNTHTYFLDWVIFTMFWKICNVTYNLLNSALFITYFWLKAWSTCIKISKSADRFSCVADEIFFQWVHQNRYKFSDVGLSKKIYTSSENFVYKFTYFTYVISKNLGLSNISKKNPFLLSFQFQIEHSRPVNRHPLFLFWKPGFVTLKKKSGTMLFSKTRV